MVSNHSFVLTTGAYKTAAVCSYPTNCIEVELQAIGASIRYTLDGTDPIPGYGMVLLDTKGPKVIRFEDFLNIKFCRQGGVAGTLAIYFRT